MASSTIDIKCRPLKLGFVVNPYDRASLLESMELSTFLWGGACNPIIPFLRRMPNAWKSRLAKGKSCADMMQGYIDAYDPDVLVYFNEAHKESLSGSREVISAEEILSGFDEWGCPRHGVGLPEILRHILSTEMKYVSRYPLRMCIPYVQRKNRLLVTAVFGAIPQPTEKKIRRYVEACEGEVRNYSHQTFVDFMGRDNMFYRRMTMIGLERSSKSRQMDSARMFYFDAADPLDVIDYWNLRAIGSNVLPIPQQVAHLPDVKRYTMDYICENFWQGKQGWPHRATFLYGATCRKNDVTGFLKELEDLSPSPDPIPEFSVQSWYPRLWDSWARERDGAMCWSIEHKSSSHNVQGDSSTLSVPQVDPEILDKRASLLGRRFANEVELRIYGGSELGAEVVPEAPSTMARAFTYGGLNEWRFSANGPVYLADYEGRHLTIKHPLAERVFAEWMMSKGWDVSLSSPGRIASQMLKQLEGVWGVSLLAKSKVLDLLEDLAGEKSMTHSAIWAAMQRIANSEEFRGDPEHILRGLVDYKVLHLGLKLKCPVCQQHSWYSISDADYDLACPKCLETYSVPSHSPNDMQWSYRALGPFSLPRKSYGVYSVLLTLRFFSRVMDSSTTPMLSFIATKGDVEMEVDLGLFYQKSMFRDTPIRLVFAECKMYMSFKRVDVQKMNKLAEEFPGCILVFATLRSTLTKTERSLLTPIVNRNRRARESGRPFSHVIILTSTELFANWNLGDAWKKAGGSHAKFGNFYDKNMESIADITQQLYLELESWLKWLDSRRRKQLPPHPKQKLQQNKKKQEPPRDVSVRISTVLQEVRC